MENPMESAPRPSSIATASVDDALIVSIVERVKLMDGRFVNVTYDKNVRIKTLSRLGAVRLRPWALYFPVQHKAG